MGDWTTEIIAALGSLIVLLAGAFTKVLSDLRKIRRDRGTDNIKQRRDQQKLDDEKETRVIARWQELYREATTRIDVCMVKIDALEEHRRTCEKELAVAMIQMNDLRDRLDEFESRESHDTSSGDDTPRIDGRR